MRTMFLTVFLFWTLASNVSASCTCACVNGVGQPLCTSSLDIKPSCAQLICSVAPPSIKPANPLNVPPPGSTNCQMQQVLNPTTKLYEWKQVCN
ncbi:MAG: hypothetical protein O2963_05630 [Proteobacteria bacterium]|jgi:hypothetical protein|nr:hypothetical protein [Pseudomonadota bacterium]